MIQRIKGLFWGSAEKSYQDIFLYWHISSFHSCVITSGDYEHLRFAISDVWSIFVVVWVEFKLPSIGYGGTLGAVLASAWTLLVQLTPRTRNRCYVWNATHVGVGVATHVRMGVATHVRMGVATRVRVGVATANQAGNATNECLKLTSIG